MANKTYKASVGYFNEKMLDILKKGEKKSSGTTKKSETKKKK